MQLNEAQRQAVAEFERDLLVLAGAGTGKTRVLTEKYLCLVQGERIDPRRIVAITFTQKAALEMRSRIRAAMDEQIESSTGNDMRNFWRQRRSALDEAYIGTFHGLCGAIIREFPLISGVLPGKNILGEGEERILLSEAAEKACVKMAHEGELEDREEFFRAALGFGLAFFLEQLRDIYPKIRESGQPVSTWFTDQYAPEPSLSDPVTLLRQSIEEILQSEARRESTTRSRELLNEVESRLNEILPDRHGDFSDFVEKIRIIKGLFPKNLSKALRPYIDEVHLTADAALADRSRNEFYGWTSCVRRYLEQLAEAYDEEKSAQNALDFADLQIKARDLLRDQPDIRSVLQKRYDYFMVDEFQDTNLLQLEVVDYLVGEGHTRGRLFVVGDAKQSIYRFRGAQVEVVRKLEDKLAKRNGLVLPLVENYRCHPGVIDTINQVADSIFASDSLTYQPLIAGRPDDATPISRVHLIMAEAESDRRAEAEKLADHLYNLVNVESPLVGAEDRKRPICYGDMAILFRAMTHAEEYTSALERRGIPFIQGSGSGYYGLQEVQDQLNLVRLVQNSRDAISLLALLRSPYVGFSDADLYWMAKERNDLLETFYLCEDPPIGCDDYVWSRVKRFRKFLQTMQYNRSVITVSEIIRTALKELGYQQVIMAFPGAERKLANLDKLLHKADAFAALAGRYSIGQFLEYIGNLVAYQTKEPEANLEGEGSDAVRILTIHSSKGLEFPLVVLVDLERKLSHPERSSILYHPEYGLAFKIPDGAGGYVDPPLRDEIKERNAVEEKAELKRLLYVAMTRAKDYLVLSGIGDDMGEESSIPTWAGWLRSVLPKEATNGEESAMGGHPIRLIRTPFTQPIQQAEFLEQPLIGEPAEREIAAGLEPEIVEAALPREMTTKRRRIAVTSLMTYLECPRQYYLLYKLGLEVESKREGEGNPEGALIGRIVHGLCALEDPKPAWVEERINRGILGIPLERRERAEAAIRRLWSAYTRSYYPKLSGQVYSEFPFALALGVHHRLHGIIDRMIDTDRGVLITDFKTNRISESDDLDRLAEHYRPQLMTYALAVHSIFKQIPQIELYFLDAEKVLTFKIDETSILRWKDQISSAADALFEGRDAGDFLPAHECGKCPQRKWCPDHKA